MNQAIQQKLVAALAFNGAMLLQATTTSESQIRGVLDAAVKIVDPVARGTLLSRRIIETTNMKAMRPITERLTVSDRLAKFMDANSRGEKLEYEFQTDRDNYEGDNTDAAPIDVTKLVGSVGMLVSVLSAVGCELEWPPRFNGAKATFIIKS